MLGENVKELLNEVFQKAKIPIEIKTLFLYRPVYHDPLFEHFEPIKEANRLAVCDPIFIEIEVDNGTRRYEFQLRYRNERRNFLPKFYWLKYCDIYPKEDPKTVEEEINKNMEFIAKILSKVLEILSRE